MYDFLQKPVYVKKSDNLQSTLFSELSSAFLTNEEQTLCEGPLTQTECSEALKKMESDKTPGTDGLPAEFYKGFWKDISSFLISALNYAFDSGCLSVTQRRGVIPKKRCGTILHQKLETYYPFEHRLQNCSKIYCKPN